MAASFVPEIDARIWDLLESGDEEGARCIQDALAVLEKVVNMTGGAVRKEILVRRGVFTCSAKRNTGIRKLNEHYLYELEHGLRTIEPYPKL